MTKMLEHDNIIFITLPFFHSKSWEHDEKNGSMTKMLEHDNIIFITLPFFHSKIWEHDKKIGSMIKKLGARLTFCCTCSQIFYHAPRIVEVRLLSLFLKGHLPGFHFSRGQSFEKFCVAPRFSSCSNYFYHAPIFFIMLPPSRTFFVENMGA